MLTHYRSSSMENIGIGGLSTTRALHESAAELEELLLLQRQLDVTVMLGGPHAQLGENARFGLGRHIESRQALLSFPIRDSSRRSKKAVGPSGSR